jgi:hypothetical protein
MFKATLDLSKLPLRELPYKFAAGTALSFEI